MELTWPLLLTGIILGMLCILFLILLINLLTFQRLHPTQTPEITTLPLPIAPEKVCIHPAPFTSTAKNNFRSYNIINYQYPPTVKKTSDATDCGLPLASILVPARNEENCIENCLKSLLAQRYDNFEILVLDDQSSDATATIVQSLITALPSTQSGRLRLLTGEPLPADWIGKNFACHQLAQEARGSFLLFTDADTVHAPDMLSTILASLQQLNVQLLTAQPEQILGSLGERLVVPLLNFTILTLLPIALIRLRPEPGLATGTGQLLCFERSAYSAIGGHMSVKERILEDVLLARKVKAAGYRMAFVDGLELIQCRMYHSFTEVWNGFSKNLFAFYNYSLPFALIALLLNLVLFVLPLCLVLTALWLPLAPSIFACSLASYMLATLMHMCLTVRFIRSSKIMMLLLNLLHPLSILLECLILLNSIRWRYRKNGTLWKGRTYNH